jgi:RNA polymerase sigma-70 factor (ECF subfamily)
MVAGDERALGELYDRWSAVARALAFRIVGDRDEAEDVVEETFWQLWRQAERFDASRGSVSTWLATVTRSRALDRRRALERRREERGGDAEVALEPALADAPVASEPSVDPSAHAEHAERRALVAAALRELPAEQRQAVQLAYFDGLSQSEIAEQLGQPLGTVKTRMRLAMQKLRERFARLREDVR